MKSVLIFIAIIMLFGSLKKPDSRIKCDSSIEIKFFHKGKHIYTEVQPGTHWISQIDRKWRGTVNFWADSVTIRSVYNK